MYKREVISEYLNVKINLYLKGLLTCTRFCPKLLFKYRKIKEQKYKSFIKAYCLKSLYKLDFP